MSSIPALAPVPGDRFRLRSLFTLAPLSDDHWVGLRAGLGVMLPLLLLVALRRLDLAPYVVFGAFASLYSRVPGHLDRLLMQLKASGLMWLVILLAWFSGSHLVRGAQGPGGVWLLVGATTVVAGVSSVAAGLLRLRPAGPLFHIFAFAAISSMPSQPGLGDGMFAATSVMVLALVLGQLGRVAPLQRTPWQVTPAPGLSPRMVAAIWREGLAYLLAAGVAGGVAALVAGPLGMGHTYWAMVAAVVPLAGRSTRHRLVRAVHRVLGTAGGLVLMVAVVVLHPSPWVAVLIIGVMQFLTEVFVVRNYFWGQVFVTPMALVGTSLGVPLSGAVLYDRAVETVIGAVVGVAVVLLMNAFSRSSESRVHVIEPG